MTLVMLTSIELSERRQREYVPGGSRLEHMKTGRTVKSQMVGAGLGDGGRTIAEMRQSSKTA